tara:strand:- start:24 stop:671 length:648 start_codon:yes stop_codon:yes gene_type:complete
MLVGHYLLVQFVLQEEIYTMSNKNLLNESTIRKFMKLASIEPLASDFLGRIQEAEEELEEGRDKEELDEAEEDLEEGRDKDEMDEGKHDDDLEEGRDKDDVDEGKHDDDLDERGDMMFKDDEEEVDMGMDAEAGGKMVDVDAFIAALESALEDTMGEPAEVEYEEEEAELDAVEPEADLDMGAELDLDAEEEEEEEEDLAEAIYREVLKKISKKK